VYQLNEKYHIGIDIGGTKILAVIANKYGLIYGTATRKTPALSDATSIVKSLAYTATEAADNAGIKINHVDTIGLAAAGAIDSSNGTIIYSPHLPTLVNTPVGSMLREMLTPSIYVGNDANLAALGEKAFGAGKFVNNFVFITISTGIGGGIIIDNKLWTGSSGYAGELGHMTINALGPYGKSATPGAWESLCSGSALTRIAKERIDMGENSSLKRIVESSRAQKLTAEDIFSASIDGDDLANQIIDDAIFYLGTGLTSIVNVLSPEKIIIGGGLSNQWENYVTPAIKLMHQQAYADSWKSVDVVPSELGANAGALGAIVFSQQFSK
tara:strand:+ start:5665 stop:6645 length:981 start_codon:yes stop_codon:yes gene_type:complete